MCSPSPDKPTPAQREHRFLMRWSHRPAQEAELDRGAIDTTGIAALRSASFFSTMRARAWKQQALGAGGADAVGRHRLDHARARQPRQRRDRGKGESRMPGITKCCQVPASSEIGRTTEIAEHDHQDQGEPEARIASRPDHRELHGDRRGRSSCSRAAPPRMPSGIEIIKREAQPHQAERASATSQAPPDQAAGHAVLGPGAALWPKSPDHGAADPAEELDVERALEPRPCV